MNELSNDIELHYLRTRPTDDLQIKKEKLRLYIEKCVEILQKNECDISISCNSQIIGT